ncbi:MAG: PorP/SprF family type IX secretion system membrane protein, partial [Bacteroidia bacterium]
MKKKKLILLSVIFLMPSLMAFIGGAYSFLNKLASAYAQQMPFSSQYYTNSFVVNPAFTGNGDYINAFLTHRSQWTGLAGAPQTSYLTADGPLKNKNMGLGMRVHTDVTDIISRVGAFANYSYKLKLNDSSHLYFGVALGALSNKLDFSKAVIKDNSDPFLFQQSRSKTVISADLGVAYVWKRLTVGFAIPQFFGNSIKYTILNDDNTYYNLKRHYQGTIKYEFDVIKEKGITAYPLVMFRSVKGAPFQYDINGVVDWKNKGWFGLTFHSNYAFAISAGARYKNFIFGYAYDIGVNKVRSYLGTTSEFLLGYTFAERKKSPDLDELQDNNDSLLFSKINKDSLQSLILAQLKAIADSNKAELAKGKGLDNDGQSAYISGRLIDEQGNPVPDATVEVVNKSNNQVVARPITGSDGTVRVAVPPGKTYDVVFNKSGYLYKPMNVTVPETPGFEWSLKDVTLQKLEVGKKVVLNNILFDLNRATLKSESYAELEQTVKLIKDIPSLEMEVSGHTDNVGSASANKQLSEQRAKAVMDYLVSKGCDQNRLTYKGYGASQPIADNASENGRKINRRTEFKVLKVDGDVTVVSGTDALANSNSNSNTTQKYRSSENDALLAQLKQKTDSYQQQIDELKALVANSKSSNTVAAPVDDARIAALQAKSDSNQAELEQLKAELVKSKISSLSTGDASVTDLKAKSDANAAEIEALKVELAKSKLTNTPVDDSKVVALTAKSDANAAEIEALKAELGKTKSATPADEFRLAKLQSKADSNKVEIDALKAKLASVPAEDPKVAELKAKSDANTAEIEALKAELAKSKLASVSVEDSKLVELKSKADSNKVELAALKAKLASVPAEDPKVAELKAKSDANTAEIEALKAELAKSKLASTPVEDSKVAELKAKSDANAAEIEALKA